MRQCFLQINDTYEVFYSSFFFGTGPDTWWLHYPSASGGNQSPIDIVAEEVTFDPELWQHPLIISYPPPRPASAVEPMHHGKDDDDDDDAVEYEEEASGYGAEFSDMGAVGMSGYTPTSACHGLGGMGCGGRSLSDSCSGGGGGGRRSREKMTIVNTGNGIRVDVSNSRSREFCEVVASCAQKAKFYNLLCMIIRIIAIKHALIHNRRLGELK